MTQQAKLPISNDSGIRRIHTLKVGEYGYVLDWALHADTDYLLWIDGDIKTEPTAFAYGEPLHMAIYRLEDGYHVWVVPGFRLSPTGRKKSSWLPVVALHVWEDGE